MKRMFGLDAKGRIPPCATRLRKSRINTQPRERLSTGKGLFRATFIVPNQDENAGGVYAIQKWALHLAGSMNVNLLVQDADPEPLPGVNVQPSPELAPETVPDADVILLYINAPADEPFFGLPESKGEKMLMFQGYTEPGSETVRSRLRLGLRVVAPSQWLTEDARQLGSRATHTPYGLDSEIFFPGRPAHEREAVVSMLCHSLDWKGTDDGIAALEIVRNARPETKFKLFGVGEPDFPAAEFRARLSRTEVASLLRESAVFVCASWEEGFGMPGLEAQACGTALATTDTKGSRDYAIDERTALVSPPRDSEALAGNILRFLDDVELRNRVATEGADYAHSHFHSWSEATRVMHRALVGNPE
jgi:glycosyltransferase involved in cell wall biosynthesis